VFLALQDVHPDVERAPFQRALRVAAEDLGLPAENWLDIRATAAFTACQHQR
jgi:hypothetical protein